MDVKDYRIACKYGEKCYQKNPAHHQKFKHPAKEELPAGSVPPEDIFDEGPAKKKIKLVAPIVPKRDDILAHSLNDEIEESKNKEKMIEDDENEGETECELPPSPSSVQDRINMKFLLDMPDDFYDLWQFCKKINPSKPREVLSVAGLRLVGPYDELDNQLTDVKPRKLSRYLCHWRFYFDPPEFQTVIIGSDVGFHIGYFRDSPDEDPAFVGSMSDVKPGHIACMGKNIFAAINFRLSNISYSTPSIKGKMQKLSKELEVYAIDHGHSLESKTATMKARDKHVVARTFHGAGIVVPVDHKTEVGYRELPETDANLKRILKRIVESKTSSEKEKRFDDLQEIMTNVQFANDEGDFGMGLELGIDLFIQGGNEFHSSISHLLSVAYDLLDRKVFGQILRAHLKNRRKGNELSSFTELEKV